MEGCWLALAVLTPSLFNPASLRVFEPEKVAFVRSIVLLMLALWAIQALFHLSSSSRLSAPPSPGPAVPFLVPVAALAAAYLLAALLSELPRESVLGSYRRQFGALTHLSFAAVFVVVGAHLRSPSQAARLLAAIALGTLIPSLYGVAQKAGLDPIAWTGDNSWRVAGTLGLSTYLGSYLAAALPATIYMLRRSGSRRWRGGLMALLALQAAALLFSQTRASWLGALAGIAVALLAASGKAGPPVGQHVRRLALGLGLALVFLVAVNLPDTGINRFARSIPYLDRAASLADLGSGSGLVRAMIWQTIPSVAAERPLLGHGPEMMGYAFERHYPPEIAYVEGRTAFVDRAHSQTLQVLASAGALGLGAFLWLVVSALWALTRVLSRTEREMVAPVLGGIVAGLVDGMAGVPSASAYLIFWLYLGLAAFLLRRPALSPVPPSPCLRVPASPCPPVPPSPRLRAPASPRPYLGAAALLAVAAMGILRLNLLPLLADTAAARGSDLASQGRFGEARDAYLRALDLNPEAEYGTLLGQMATRAAEGRPAVEAERWLLQGQEALQGAERLNPLDLDVALAQGKLYQARATLLGRPADQGRSEDAFRRALALSPRRSYVRNRYGAALAAQGRHEDALAEYRISASLDPKYAATHGFMGDSLEARGSLQEALEAYEEARRLDPDLVLVRINLAELYLRLGRGWDAVAEYEAAIALSPGDQSLRVRRAGILERLW